MKIIEKIKRIIKNILNKIFRRKTDSDVRCYNDTPEDWDSVCYIYNDCVYDEIIITADDFDSSGIIYDSYKHKKTKQSNTFTQRHENVNSDDSDVEKYKQEYIDNLIKVFNAERNAKGLDKIDQFPEPNNIADDGWYYNSEYNVFCFENDRKYHKDKQQFDVPHPNEKFHVTWYDNRELYDVYIFSSAEDGHIESKQICSDEEKLEKFRNRKLFSKTFSTFDDAIKGLDELCIHAEYIIYDCCYNVVTAS